jgi:hypothetical protein
MPTPPILLTPTELTLLGNLLGAPVLHGVPDPFFTFLAIEVDVTLELAKSALIKRGILLEQEEGPPIMALSVAQMVGALCFPQSSLRLVVDEEAGPLVIWFHRTRNLTVSVTGSLKPCVLQAYPDEPSIIRAILERLWNGMASLEQIGGSTLSLDGQGRLYIDRSGKSQEEEATWEQVEAAVAELVHASLPGAEAEDEADSGRTVVRHRQQ